MNNLCRVGHDTRQLSVIGFPGIDSPTAQSTEAKQARNTILSCPFCLGIISGKGKITCFSGEQSWPLVALLFYSDHHEKPRYQEVLHHFLNCLHCQEFCRKNPIDRSEFEKYVKHQRLWRRRKARKIFEQLGLLLKADQPTS